MSPDKPAREDDGNRAVEWPEEAAPSGHTPGDERRSAQEGCLCPRGWAGCSVLWAPQQPLGHCQSPSRARGAPGTRGHHSCDIPAEGCPPGLTTRKRGAGHTEGLCKQACALPTCQGQGGRERMRNCSSLKASREAQTLTAQCVCVWGGWHEQMGQ